MPRRKFEQLPFGYALALALLENYFIEAWFLAPLDHLIRTFNFPANHSTEWRRGNASNLPLQGYAFDRFESRSLQKYFCEIYNVRMTSNKFTSQILDPQEISLISEPALVTTRMRTRIRQWRVTLTLNLKKKKKKKKENDIVIIIPYERGFGEQPY